MVGVTKIQRGNANYWIEAVADGEEDYYAKPGEAPGRLARAPWRTSSRPQRTRSTATPTRPSSPARTRQLARRLSTAPSRGRSPTPTAASAGWKPMLGYDVRFAAPKSVSLLYAIGSPEVRAAVLRAHEEAVAEADRLPRAKRLLRAARQGRRSRSSPAPGFVAMAFRHRSSRAGDPALHTHVVTANMTRAASDGRWLSLANPRRALAASARGESPPATSTRRRCAPTLTRELGARVERGPQRLRRPGWRSSGR